MRITTTYRKVGAFYIACIGDLPSTELGPAYFRIADNPGVSDEMRVGTTIPGERLKSPIDNLYEESQTHIVIR